MFPEKNQKKLEFSDDITFHHQCWERGIWYDGDKTSFSMMLILFLLDNHY